ncbi:uncharacterized protein DUF1573 [Tenacibaculum adriaticum]|uniref:Uncharacterized protein DUF1573 n=1 Tax=Tenacibaculum adriaticum TaxID=413713 RepID=A0A5S5DSE7_9FLAO|nr:DUF1573 domain-containing protein [Tenacibaculum adriaticum]TYP98298.1 uncharacterized protein DUF1573 [Tenacibaculum adriaticum]
MKKISVIATFAVVVGMLVSCGQENASSKIKKENVLNAQKRDNDISKGAPVISFDREEHDFGTVNEGDIVETSFMVTNTGKSNLVITNAKATCGCTVPTWPKEPVAPGESAEIKVKFNTSGKRNKQSKTVTLYTNTAKGTEAVKISGMVTPKKGTPTKQLKEPKDFKLVK